MGGSRDQTTTTESEPWAAQQPYLRDLFSQGQQLYQQGPQQYFPGQTVAPFSPQTQMAFDMMTQTALGPNPQFGAFGNYLQQQLGQQNIDPSMMFGFGGQAAGGIGPGQDLMMQGGQAALGAGQPNQMVGDAAGALGGMTGFGGLGEAQQFAGQAQPGALPSSLDYVNQTLGQSPTFQDVMGFTGAGQFGGLDPTAAAQLGATAAGDYLGGNPYLDQVFDTAASRAGEAFQEQTMPALAAQFGSAGRTGSGIHQEMGQNAMRQFGRDLQGLAGDIYAPAYEAERGRQLQAAQGLGGLDISGQQVGLGGLGLAGDIYGGEQQRRLGAAGLGGDLFSRMNQADMGRLGLASQHYLGERGLGQQGAQALGQLGIGQGQLGLGGLQAAIGAGADLGQLGLGGLGAMGDLYGNIAQNQFRAGSLMPQFQDMRYGDAQRLFGVGSTIEDQAQRYIDANMNRWNFGQQAPWQNLGQYAGIIQGLPSGYGTSSQTQPGGSRLGGAIGGGLAGWGATGNPWGAAIGALGGLL